MTRARPDRPATEGGPLDELRAQFADLEEELRQLMEQRSEIESRIADLERQAATLRAEHSEVCEKEGRLRGQIGALKQAVGALDR